ncbi:hypothetical protein [Massilia scottii]|uniref:hypothetical protein n=1 Tax=Massilia scottii TaxID=3057166 RepID=UPI0027966BB7|nr:hypothetical protein [Massilia sp. CCM 9029]MDQ1831348.1 hypothetical protein [Massilia sp. CCM 9029]
MMRKLTAILLAGALLTACGMPQIHHTQLTALDKGLAPPDVVARLKLEPSVIHNAQADGRTFEFYQYRMNNGMQTDQYLIVFEGAKLVYWGYLDELRKHPDKALAAAAGQVASAVLAVR